jgi:WD40 repeat protein
MDEDLVDLLEQFDERVRTRRSQDAATSGARRLAPATRRELAGTVKCLRLIERVRRTSESNLPLREETADDVHPLRTIGRFKIVREIGSGGHGMVFLAWDPATRRHVALKIPHPDALFTPQLRERFLREGIAAARLTHPNIVPVLEVDHSGPLCYIVSAFVDGQSLSALIAERVPLDARLVAQWVAELSDAVEHAHRHGVVHRDLKPANVLLEPRQAPLPEGDALSTTWSAPAGSIESPSDLTPRLTDFGLAKLVDVEDVRTRTGVMLGTPAYMAPEQIDSSLGQTGAASDVYGLGAVLYECLTGRPMFASENQAELLRQIASGEFVAPHQLRNDLPRDLEAICLRATSRNPSNRYGSAAALAADLRRFLAGDATSARPMGVFERSLRWARRHPSAAAAACVAMMAAISATGGAIWHSAQMNAALTVAEDARIRAEQGERKLQQLVYLRDMQEAHAALESQDVLKAKSILSRYDRTSGTPGGFLRRHLQARATGTPIITQAHEGHAHTVDFAPDGLRVVTTGADGFVRIWDATTASLRAMFRSQAAEVNVARFSPDGASVAVADSDGRMWIMDATTLAPRYELPVTVLQNINCLAWTQDGSRVLAGGNPGAVVLEWEVATQSIREIPFEHTQEVNAIALSPDDRLLATGSSDGVVFIRERANSKAAPQRLVPNQSHVTCLSFSPDGEFLATAGVHHSVRVWKSADWTLAATYDGHVGRIGAVVFAPCEPEILFTDGAGVVRLWQWADDLVETVIDGGQGRILSAAFSPSERRVAACASNGTLGLWDFERRASAMGTLPELRTYLGTFTRDSRFFVTSDGGARIAVFDTQQRTIKHSRERDENLGGVLHLVPCGLGGVGVLWQKGSHAVYKWGTAVFGPQTSVVPANRFAIGSFAVTPDDRILISAQRWAADSVRFTDVATGLFAGETTDLRLRKVQSLSCSSDGSLLAVGGSNGAGIWDLKQRRLLRELPADIGDVVTVTFSPDNQLLATGGADGRVCLWDPLACAKPQKVLAHSAPISCLSFCPDEPVIVTGDDEGIVRAWSIATGEELFQLAKFPFEVHMLTFSPDGQWLVAGYLHQSQQQLQFWRAPKNGSGSRTRDFVNTADAATLKPGDVNSGD